mmetsp:Transcript_13395/g.28307  ORF Transcript_13395/g.28307 Transcript_13395/m.28307 type:complete len:523 (+) Transcript_13395:1-1569(+)
MGDEAEGGDTAFGAGGPGWDDGVPNNFGGNSGMNNNNNMDRWSEGGEGHGDGNERLDDFVNRRRRRLMDEGIGGLPDFDDPHETMDMMDDGVQGEWNGNTYGSDLSDQYGVKLTARHLFCLAADALVLPKADAASTAGTSSASKINNPSIHCDMSTFEIRESLLNLWSSARSQMPVEVITKTLRLVTEQKESLRGNEVYIWHPKDDEGTKGMLRVLNSGFEGREVYNFDTEPADQSHDDLYRFWDLPPKFVGPNKLFVDVGSALGLTSMLMAYTYPGTTIVSIEPASPSWLIQNINYRCNLSHEKLQYVHPILAGVGTKHHDDSDSMMKMTWKPSLTTATRSWSPEKEFDFAKDIELTVHLRTLRAILAEATPDDLPLGTPISVLNLDCEGCEYNLIPSMHDTTFNSIGIIMGRTNWGYIPKIKKPSSDRAKTTHQRVCAHYNFAKRCKECCDFPDLAVKPRLKSGNSDFDEANSEPVQKTVAEVAGSLCDGFDEWARDSKLHDIPDDYGWNEMSAFAAFAD